MTNLTLGNLFEKKLVLSLIKYFSATKEYEDFLAKYFK